MKVIIAGSRALTDPAFFDVAIRLCPFLYDIEEVVCGGAKGVDWLGWEWANSRRIPVTVFKADWETYGKRAGVLRNKEMADYADALIYIRYVSTPGTANMIEQMQKQNKRVWGVTVDAS